MKIKSVTYEMYADEAWTHQSSPLHRYHTFFGGAFGYEKQMARLEGRLKSVPHTVRQEIKWQNVNQFTWEYYSKLIDVFKDHILYHGVKYRQMFNDRFFEYKGSESEVDSQFKLYYQFLKHQIPWKEISQKNRDDFIRVNVRLDNYSSQQHKDKLKELGESIPRFFNIENLKININFVNSHRYIILQVCDLIMGAAGYHGNRLCYDRHNGVRGMTSKQKARVQLTQHIYDALRDIDAKTRGSKAFNWFSNTSYRDRSQLDLSVSIWKFRPNNHIENRKWNNSNFPDRRSLSEVNMIEK